MTTIKKQKSKTKARTKRALPKTPQAKSDKIPTSLYRAITKARREINSSQDMKALSLHVSRQDIMANLVPHVREVVKSVLRFAEKKFTEGGMTPSVEFKESEEKKEYPQTN